MGPILKLVSFYVVHLTGKACMLSAIRVEIFIKTQAVNLDWKHTLNWKVEVFITAC